MWTSLDADLKRFVRHDAGSKLAGSGHMYMRRVLLVWAYGIDLILVVPSLKVRMKYAEDSFGHDDIILVDIDKIRSAQMTAREAQRSST
jgi:hypothetical protein